jgi:[ribosomal protein S5]-alanine N-acetyltransferase
MSADGSVPAAAAGPRVAQRGERIGLRPPLAADRDEFTKLRRLSRALHEPWEPWPEDGTDAFGPGAFDGFLSTSDTERKKRYLAVELASGAIIGYAGLSEIVRGPFQSAYMGYWVGAPYARHGFATEAVGLLLRHSFTVFGLHRVEANIIPQNAGSLAVARRCGLRREGFSPRYLKIAGRWQDHERWALTVEDWLASHVGSG